MPSDALVLAVDVGTGAVRAAAFDADGGVRAAARTPRPPAAPDGGFEPDDVWDATARAVRGVVARVPAAEIRCVGVTGVTGTVFLDGRDLTVGPARDWSAEHGADAQPAAVIDAVRRLAHRPVVSAGALLHARRLDPRDRARVAHVLTPKDDVVRRLAGVHVTDATSAGYTQLFDVAAGTWSGELCEHAGLPDDVLPPVRAATEVVGVVHAAAAACTGLRAGIPVVAGGPDGTVGAAALLGDAASARCAAVADVSGTTDVLTRLGNGAAVPAGAVLNRYVLGGSSVTGPTGRTGGLLDDTARALGRPDTGVLLAELGSELDAVVATGIVEVAAGPSRFPHWRSGPPRPTLRHGPPAQVLHAVALSVAARMSEALDVLAGPSVPVLLAGGATRSPFLVRLRADVTGRELHPAVQPDVTLHGAAMLAGLGVGLHLPLAPLGTPVQPDPERAAAYRALVAGHRSRGRDA